MRKLYSLLSSGTVWSQFLQILPITLLIGVIYAVYRCVRIKRQGNTVFWGTEILRWLFVCYLTGLVNLILMPAHLWMYIWANIFAGYSHSEFSFFSGTFNLVPTVFKWMRGELTIGPWVLEMLIGNFLLFVPFGFFLPFVFKKINRTRFWIIAVIVPAAVEGIQPIVGRSFDVDDLILNFAGIVAGYFAAAAVKALLQRLKKTDR